MKYLTFITCLVQPTCITPKVFISYCWSNSLDAVEKGTTKVKGALGFYDPRQLKDRLEEKGISCWMDIDRVAQVRVVHDCSHNSLIKINVRVFQLK